MKSEHWVVYQDLFCFFIDFILDFLLFIVHIFFQRISSKKIKICKNKSKNHHHYLPQIIEDGFILADEKYSEKVDTRSPDNRSYGIVDPEFSLLHTARTSNKWYKWSRKIMKFSKNNIPKSVFFYLFWEYFLFCFSESDVVTIFLDDLMSIPFSDPISDIISDHGTKCSQENRSYDMSFSPKSTNKNHNIHPWKSCSDNREWFCTSRDKCNKIIPISKYSNEFTNPSNSWFYQLWFYERDNYQDERKNSEEYSDRLSECDKKSLECLHTAIVWKKATFAKKTLWFWVYFFDKITRFSIFISWNEISLHFSCLSSFPYREVFERKWITHNVSESSQIGGTFIFLIYTLCTQTLHELRLFLEG